MLSALRLAVAACLAGSVASFAPAAPGRLGSVSQLTAPALPLHRPAFCASGCGFPLPPRALGHRPGEQGMHNRGRALLWCEQSLCARACVRACVRACGLKSCMPPLMDLCRMQPRPPGIWAAIARQQSRRQWASRRRCSTLKTWLSSLFGF